MIFINRLNVLLSLTLISQVLSTSFNRPKFCPNTTWNPNATTIATKDIVGSKPYFIFITTNNTIYVPNIINKHIIVLSEPGSILTRNISITSNLTHNVFVTDSNDIYFEFTWNSIHGIRKLTQNSSNDVVIMETSSKCFQIFVDNNNSIYCAMSDDHQVLTKSLNNISDPVKIIAGLGIAGSTSFMLNWPHGLFIDTNFELYVADRGNHRIQFFPVGQSYGITIAGEHSSVPTIHLNNPTVILLDANKYLFIVDHWNHRIVGSGLYGFRCVVGCTNSYGSQSDRLYYPRAMSFDSYGNILVADEWNNRIQKFSLITNSCNESIVNNVTYSSINESKIIASNITNGISYNQPKFCSNATWNTNATTILSNSSLMKRPYALFINNNNTIYTIGRTDGQIIIWLNNSPNPKTISHDKLLSPTAIFVTNHGDIYIAISNSVNLFAKSISYSNVSMSVMNVTSQCMGIFVDISNMLYCSIDIENQVLKKWLKDKTSVLTRIAGNGSCGSTSNMLCKPNGVFVDTNFDLYVAEFANHRIQLFRLGQLDGITVAGKNSMIPTIKLNSPLNVILDGDKYLFISDSNGNRIVGSDKNGFRCIVGCYDSGSTSSKLNYSRAIAFDTFGNLYVADSNNNRIQKFMFQTNSCKSLVFIPSKCPDKNKIGMNCNILSTPCNLLNPCGKNEICMDNNTITFGYECKCKPGFYGLHCEENTELCKVKRCWNNGKCKQKSNATFFECQCLPGWTGVYCEKKINYCEYVTCQNNAVCRPLFMNYSCECLSENFSGRHCEKIARKIVILRIVSRSVGYVAILFLVFTASFFVFMDVLKYCFGIDLTEKELKRIREEKAKKKIKHRPVIQRFVYVNASSNNDLNFTTN